MNEELFRQFLYALPFLLLSLVLHEMAHGWVAWLLGDPTAAARARAAMRWLLLHTEVRVRSSSPPKRSTRASLRELALWPLLPFQLWRAGRG